MNVSFFYIFRLQTVTKNTWKILKLDCKTPVFFLLKEWEPCGCTVDLLQPNQQVAYCLATQYLVVSSWFVCVCMRACERLSGLHILQHALHTGLGQRSRTPPGRHCGLLVDVNTAGYHGYWARRWPLTLCNMHSVYCAYVCASVLLVARGVHGRIFHVHHQRSHSRWYVHTTSSCIIIKWWHFVKFCLCHWATSEFRGGNSHYQYYYFIPGGKRSIVISISVRLCSYSSKTMGLIFTSFYAYFLSPWLGPPLIALQYVCTFGVVDDVVFS